MEDGVFFFFFKHTQKHTRSGGDPGGEILPESPALFPVLFLCEEPVLFKYNGGSRKLQHLSDRHSIIVTQRPVTTNAANSNHKTTYFFLINTFLLLLAPLLWKCLKNKILKSFTLILLSFNPFSAQPSAESHKTTLLKHLWSLGSCFQNETLSSDVGQRFKSF